MKKLFLPVFLTFILGLAACSTQVVLNKTRVEKMSPGTPPSLNGMDYALPRTVIDVDMIVEKSVTKPGPFAEYAERYLGVTKVPTREVTEYKILEVKINTHAERDPDQVYRVFTEGVSPAGRLSLNHQGVINGVNLPAIQNPAQEAQALLTVNTRQQEQPGYPDLTIRKNTEPMLDTIYRVVRTDTSFIRLPLLKSQISQKNLSNQAEEAANFIMKLRKRRFYLMTGEYAYRDEVRTPMPEGDALEVIVRELAQLEYDYVSLFVGRTITEQVHHTFTYIPTGQGAVETNDLFVFSRFRGILPAGNSNGDPVSIQLVTTFDPKMTYTTHDFEMGDNKEEVRKGLAYRIPGRAQVSLSLNNESLAGRELLVNQYGVVQFLPSKTFENVATAVEYHAESGMIKQIYQKK